MGVLDELQAEIDNKKSAEQLHEEEEAARQAYYQHSLKPVMAQTYQYLAELVEKLNAVAPDIRPCYPFNPLAEDELQLLQSDYKFRVDDGQNPHQIDVICNCTLPRPQEYHVPTADAAERYARLLDKYRMVYHRKEFRDKYQNIQSATFILEGPLRVHIRLSASAAEHCIFVDLRNLEVEPVKRYRLQPKQIDHALLDRLARMLIRQDSQLITTQVSEDSRLKLQRTLEDERKLRESKSAHAPGFAERRGFFARLFRRD